MERNIRIANGEEKASLVLKNANIINVFTNKVIKRDIAIEKDMIVGIGEYNGKEEIDLKEKYVTPGFIDSHVHIESSMVTPGQFAKAILPRGTTSIIADPHEISNVTGIDGINYILDESKDLDLDVYLMLPSCVPSTPFENAGAVLEAEDLEDLMDNKRVLGLGEMMNYPGVIEGDSKVLNKLAITKDKIIDGHGPMITGKDLNAYIVAGVKTEHECSTIEEMKERLELGMYIHIREGSAARNLKELIKVVDKDNLRRCMFCTDDKDPSDLLKEGSINYNIKLAIKEGIEPIDAIKMATLNPAEIYGLKNKGAVAPYYKADLVIIDNLEDFNILQVFKDGRLVGENNRPLFDIEKTDNENMKNTVNIKKVSKEDLDIPLKEGKVNVIRVIPDSLITERIERTVGDDIIVEEGKFKEGKDILKVAVIERHNKTDNIGLALVENFGLRNGAIASTIAHDSHNLIVIGDNDEDILVAIKELEKVGGGITTVSNSKVLETLALEIGGIMSDESLEIVDEKLNRMLDIAYENLHVNKDIEPFMTLSFIALPVIPDLKITDLGLFNVKEFEFIDLQS